MLKIRKRRNIINFDETDFRIKCMKKQKILMSLNIKKHYAINFENRKFVIVVETINVVDDYFFSSMC